MDEVRIFLNGEVVERRLFENGAYQFNIDIEVPVRRSGWLAACVVGKPNQIVSDQYLFAHSGPVYIEYGNQLVTSSEDAQYFCAWLDRFETMLRQRNQWASSAQQRHVERQIAEARVFYERQIKGRRQVGQ